MTLLFKWLRLQNINSFDSHVNCSYWVFSVVLISSPFKIKKPIGSSKRKMLFLLLQFMNKNFMWEAEIFQL